MSSILEKSNLNKIFLVYGHLDDMFISKNLQKDNFRMFLNGYLKSLGYQQIVFYSGAKNLGKFVLDDESAVRVINKNKDMRESILGQGNTSAVSNVGTAEQPLTVSKPQKRRRIMTPHSVAAQGTGRNPSEIATEQSTVNNAVSSTKSNNRERNESKPKTGYNSTKLVYKQPKITPVEFLEDAKKIMADESVKSAVVFAFFQDFFTDHAAPLQPYLELVSHLWDEYSANANQNICIFLAPQMTRTDLNKMLDGMENGYVLKNRFFNDDGTVNRGTALEIGLPNLDEILHLMDYLRIIGNNGKFLTFESKKRKKIASAIMYLSREADRDVNKSGYLHAIFNSITEFMSISPDTHVELTEEDVKRIYSKYKKVDESDPLKKLKSTKGWESVASRIDEIIRDYHMKRDAAEKQGKITAEPDRKDRPYSNERIDSVPDSAFRYPVPHFILRGNPGVGKTTVARLIGQIFYNEGILAKGTTIEAKRDDLVDAYVGGTAIKTTECVERAQDGVLFIDDAYSLNEKGDDHNYPKEAIDTLVPIMTNPDRYRFCMIMAGYPEPMDELLEMNSGLRSRFSKNNILTIEDYKPELLQEIFENDCRKDGYSFTGEEEGQGTTLDLELFFKNLYNQRNRADFGNARDIVALSKEVKMQCSLRDDEKRIIIADDFGNFQKYFVQHGVSSIDDIYAQIDQYVGMGFIKNLFRNIRFEVLDTIDSKKRGITPEQYPDHYIFAGNPGTGKTTVGKMIGQFYHLMEVLGGSETLFKDASDLIGEHVGESKKKTLEAIQEAIDHNQVLYIDEAYQISESSYGNEIIGAMMTKMTENANDFKMIFGMYSNKVEEFLKMNAGLKRRLRIVNFPDYTPDQLLEIFDRTLKGQGCTITDEAHERVALILKRKYEVRGDDFGNVGEVKKMFQDMKHLHLERVYADDDPSIDRYEYTLEDIPENLLKSVEDQINPKTLEDIMQELNEQIGMSDLKDIIVQKQEEIVYAQRSGGDQSSIRPGYYFFVGNPGTGKSTSAKLFAECLHSLGIVKTPNFYSCTAKDLIGQYVGETDKKTYELLKKSKNSVLFIDEAYSLSYAEGHSDHNYKKEALEQIIAFMDVPENRQTCCLIFAGYEKDMQGLYKSNSGMRSRIEEVHFRDYSAEETYEIFKLFCTKNGFELAEGIHDIYVPIFEKLKELEYFSNGRTARTIFEKTTANLKRRIVRSSEINPVDEKLIIPDDLLSEGEAIDIIGVDGK